jgi:hypothetical protein
MKMNILEETSAAPVLSPCKCQRGREISTAARGQSASGFWKNIHFMHKRQPSFFEKRILPATFFLPVLCILAGDLQASSTFGTKL